MNLRPIADMCGYLRLPLFRRQGADCDVGSRRRLRSMKWFFLSSLLAASLTPLLMPAPLPPHQRPTMVLVIDDDPADLDLAERCLRDFYCVTSTCPDAAQALEKLRKDWFDIVFVDLWLGKMSGLDLIKESRPRNLRVQFYVMSGEWSGPVGTKAMVAAMDMGAPPIVKHGLRGRRNEPLKTFREMLNLILERKQMTL